MDYEKVNIKKFNLSDNHFAKNGETWDIPTILQFVKELDLKPFDFPLICADTTYLYWSISTSTEFIYHMDRVLKSNTEYPIIISDEGELVDGAHRLCKAILNGEKTIKCVRLPYMPPSSGTTDTTKSK